MKKSFKLFSRSSRNPDALTARYMILPIVFCLVCGVLLILFGNLALRITAYVLAGVMLVCGIWSVITYIRSKPMQRITESRLATGLILLVAGTLLAFNPNYLEDFLPFIWGLALLFGAFVKIQYAFDEKALKISRWWVMLIFAAFSLIVGILSLLKDGLFGESVHIVVGILLIAEAVLDTVVFFLLRNALKKNLRPEVHLNGESAPEPPAALQEPAPQETTPQDPAPQEEPAPEGGTPDEI